MKIISTSLSHGKKILRKIRTLFSVALITSHKFRVFLPPPYVTSLSHSNDMPPSPPVLCVIFFETINLELIVCIKVIYDLLAANINTIKLSKSCELLLQTVAIQRKKKCMPNNTRVNMHIFGWTLLGYFQIITYLIVFKF